MTHPSTEIVIDKTNEGMSLMQPNDGVEMGRFRLREGVTEEAMHAAWRDMTSGYLSTQNGWRGQRLIRLEDGTFMDIACAATPACSRKICDSWAGNATCDAFLQMIEPVSIEFGSII